MSNIKCNGITCLILRFVINSAFYMHWIAKKAKGVRNMPLSKMRHISIDLKFEMVRMWEAKAMPLEEGF